jgi:hypothetical protein
MWDFLMKLRDIQKAIREKRFLLSLHAEIEAEAENIARSQIIEALLAGEILEQNPDTGRLYRSTDER